MGCSPFSLDDPKDFLDALCAEGLLNDSIKQVFLRVKKAHYGGRRHKFGHFDDLYGLLDSQNVRKDDVDDEKIELERLWEAHRPPLLSCDEKRVFAPSMHEVLDPKLGGGEIFGFFGIKDFVLVEIPAGDASSATLALQAAIASSLASLAMHFLQGDNDSCDTSLAPPSIVVCVGVKADSIEAAVGQTAYRDFAKIFHLSLLDSLAMQVLRASVLVEAALAMLGTRVKGDLSRLDCKTFLIEGDGILALEVARRLGDLGAKALSLSNKGGFIYDKRGLDLNLIARIKSQRWLFGDEVNWLEIYAKARGCKFYEGALGLLKMPAFGIFLAGDSRDRLGVDSMRRLLGLGCKSLVELSPRLELDALRMALDSKICYAPSWLIDSAILYLQALAFSTSLTSSQAPLCLDSKTPPDLEGATPPFDFVNALSPKAPLDNHHDSSSNEVLQTPSQPLSGLSSETTKDYLDWLLSCSSQALARGPIGKFMPLPTPGGLLRFLVDRICND